MMAVQDPPGYTPSDLRKIYGFAVDAASVDANDPRYGAAQAYLHRTDVREALHQYARSLSQATTSDVAGNTIGFGG